MDKDNICEGNAARYAEYTLRGVLNTASVTDVVIQVEDSDKRNVFMREDILGAGR